ncbi:MAG: LamG-like jellyroll fold domain-containing protein, partial [Cyclobacteriaceae bacterium]
SGSNVVPSDTTFATVEDYPGYALEFDGTDDYVAATISTGIPVTTNADYTIEMWVKGTPTAGTYIYSEYDPLQSNTLFGFVAGNGGSEDRIRLFKRRADGVIQLDQTSTATVFDGNWHHVAYVNDNPNGMLYIDGQQDFTVSAGGVIPSTDVSIGSARNTSAYYSGLVDEVRLWADSVKSDFSDRFIRLEGNEAKLVAYYPFDENTGITAIDGSINANHGTLTNGPVYVDSDFTSPTQLITERVDNTSVQLSWQDNTNNEDGFTVVRASDAIGTNATVVASLDPNTLTFTDNIGADTSVFYVVSSYKGDDESQSAIESGTSTAFPGYALNFDGTDDQVVTPFQENLDDFTIETWFSIDDFTDQARIVDMDGGSGQDYWTFYHQGASNVIQADLRDGAGAITSLLTPSLNTDQWYHLAYVRDGGTLFLYLDGVQVDTDTKTTFTLTPIVPMRIGAAAFSAVDFLDGQVDEVRVWDAAKPSTYFTNGEYLEAPTPNDPDLAAYYPFDENVGELIVDRSANDYSGIWTGTNSPFTEPEWVLSGASPGLAPVIASFSPTSGPTGTTVTVLGSNFNPAYSLNEIVFGGIRVVPTSGDNTQLTFEIPVGATSVSSIEVVDLDKDKSSNSLQSISSAIDRQFVVTNAPPAGLSYKSSLEFVSNNEEPYDILVGDLNNDGHQDLVVGYIQHAKINVALGVGDGTFGSFNEYLLPGGTNSTSIALGDFDNDGYQDVLVGDGFTNQMIVMPNDGTGQFNGTNQFVALTDAASDVAVADFDGDGYLDIASGMYNFTPEATEIAVALGNGDGTFGSASYFTAGTNPALLVTGDFNNDGFADIVSRSSDDDQLSLLAGDGLGGFAGANTSGYFGNDPTELAIADVNEDGDLDILAGTFGAYYIFTGNGIGGFSENEVTV